MQGFLKKLFIFLLPVGIFFIFPVIVFVMSRESYSINQSLQTQKQYPEALVGFAYSNQSGYKQALVAEKNPAVFALGTSHVGQFRKAFFIESANFVTASNAVGTVDGIYGMNVFMENLDKNNTTKILILGLDQYMFLPSDPPKVIAFENDYERFKELLMGRWRIFYLDLFEGKYSIQELWGRSQNTKSIGLMAIFRREGYRRDGSFQYLGELTDPKYEENLKVGISTLVLAIQADRASSPYNAPFSEASLSSLNKLLALCKKKNIYVIGFVPPYPQAIYQEDLRVNDIYKERILQFPKVIGSVLSNYGFELYDFTDSSILGKHDTEFVDQGHGTDKLYLRMVIYMAERNKQLAKYVDIAKDKELLKNTKRDFIEDDIPN